MLIVTWGFPGGRESTCQAGDVALILRWGRPPREGMATHPSIVAWETPEEPGRLGHHLATEHQNNSRQHVLSDESARSNGEPELRQKKQSDSVLPYYRFPLQHLFLAQSS